MGQRKRNHYVPQFLLRRFASRVDGDTSWVWQVRRRGQQKEISTRDVGVSKFFYGEPDNGVEAALSEAETEYGVALAILDRRGTPQDAVLREMVWTLAIRTRAIRNQMVSLGYEAMDQSLHYATNTEKGRAELLAHVRGENYVDQWLKRQPRKVRRQIGHAQRMQLEREFRKLAEVMGYHALAAQVKHLVRSEKRLEAGAKDAQIKTLQAPVSSWFRPACWEVHSGPETPLILGDCCAFAINEDGAPGPLATVGRKWRRVLLPISRTDLLVAYREGETCVPMDSFEAVNRMSAGVSDAAIYAASCGEAERVLATRIGKLAPKAGDDWLEVKLGESTGRPRVDAERE